MERRTFLFAGSASALTLTTGYTASYTNATSDGPAVTVREYYRRAGDAQTTAEFTAVLEELSHSLSPLREVANDVPGAVDGARREEVVEATVAEENVSADAIRETSDFFAGSVTDEEAAALAETNAVVGVTLESDEAGGELEKEWLVAPEDGEWRLVWVDDRNDPRAATREFFNEVSQTEFPGELEAVVEELAHPSSPLGNVVAYTPWYFRGIRRRELLGTAVAAENIDAGEIASKFDPVTNWSSRRQVEAVAEENAVVAVSLRDEELGAEFEQDWLVGTADGEWRVVWF